MVIRGLHHGGEQQFPRVGFEFLARKRNNFQIQLTVSWLEENKKYLLRWQFFDTHATQTLLVTKLHKKI